MKPHRRGLLYGGAAAALAGLGLHLWRLQSTGAREAPPELWATRFDQPGGGRIDMASLRGKPLLLNFWATWCVPCIREMPQLDRFAREFGPNGWQVIGVAIDQENPVREFLARRPVSYPIALAGFEGLGLGRALGNEAGGLPFTVVFGADGRLLQQKLGEAHWEDLVSWSKLASTPVR